MFRISSGNVLVALSSLVLLVATGPRAFGEGKALVGRAAPEINVIEAINAPRAYRLSELRGRVVLLEFWATWCPPCRTSIPHLEALQQRYAGQGLVILAVTDESAATARKFVEGPFKGKMTFPVMIDRRGQTNRTYGIRSIPTAYLIDTSGKVVWQGHTMQLQEAQVTEALKAATGWLAEAAKSADPDTRGMAAFQMSQTGLPNAIAILSKMLEDEDASVRQRAAVALAVLGQSAEDLKPLLRAAVTDSQAPIRAAAFGALARVGDQDSADLFIIALRDGDPLVRRVAAAGLGYLGDPAAVPPLLRALDRDDPELVKAAAVSLGKLKSPRSTARLKELGRQKRHPARVWIAVALHELGDARAVNRIKRFFSDKDKTIRRQAVAAFGELTDFDATDLYIAALEDKDRGVRKLANTALEQSTDPRAQPALSQSLGRKVDQLLPMLHSRDGDTRRKAMDQLQQLGPAATTLLIEFLKENPRQRDRR